MLILADQWLRLRRDKRLSTQLSPIWNSFIFLFLEHTAFPYDVYRMVYCMIKLFTRVSRIHLATFQSVVETPKIRYLISMPHPVIMWFAVVLCDRVDAINMLISAKKALLTINYTVVLITFEFLGNYFLILLPLPKGGGYVFIFVGLLICLSLLKHYWKTDEQSCYSD